MSRFFQFSNYAGRIVSSTQMKAYNPAGLKASLPAEVTQMVFESIRVPMVRVEKSVRFSTSTAASGKYGIKPEVISKKQKLYQENDGVPVHLKAGGLDRALFGSTVVLCAIGLMASFHFYYQMSVPKKQD